MSYQHLHFYLGILTVLCLGGCNSDIEQSATSSVDTVVLETTPPTLDEVILLPLKRDGLFGYITPNGQWKFEPQFLAAKRFRENYAAVRRGLLWEFIDTTGATLSSQKYSETRSFKENYAGVKFKQHWGFIDQTGALAIDSIYDEVWSFSEGLAMFRQGDVVGFIDTLGRVKVPAQYAGALPFSEGYAMVFDSAANFGFVDTAGRVTIPLKKRKIWEFGSGLAPFQNKGVWGFMNHQGDTIITPQYQYAWPFTEGVAQVQVEGLWGYLLPNGKWFKEPQYTSGTAFENGAAVVETETGKYHLLQANGSLSEVLPYTDEIEFNRGFAEVLIADQVRYLNTNGELVPVASLEPQINSEPVEPEVAATTQNVEVPIESANTPKHDATLAVDVKAVWKNRSQPWLVLFPTTWPMIGTVPVLS